MQSTNNEYVIMSFNILGGESKPRPPYGSPYDRKDAVLTQIRATRPDTLGVQECSTEWHYILVKELGEEYGYVGELTNYEKLIWRNAIFYRKDRFELVETKTRWLTETPDVMSRTPYYYQYRVMTHAILRDKVTGKEIVHCNTHMGFHEEERPIHWGALLKLVSEFEHPVLITGDFNAKADCRYYAMMKENGFVGAQELAPIHDDEASFWGGIGHIDFCFVTPDKIEPLVHDLLGEEVDGVRPSDHKALVVKFRLK